jgi:hypothetical protein
MIFYIPAGTGQREREVPSPLFGANDGDIWIYRFLGKEKSLSYLDVDILSE